MLYRNPIIPGFHPDPSVCRVGDDFYLVTSSFEYFPGVPVFHSRDLLNWKQIGHCLTRASQLPLHKCRASGGIYAPTIRHHAGRFYMVTTNVTHRGNFYVHTDNPAGEWSEPVWVDQPGIDPSLLFDDDGKVYFVSNGAKDYAGNRGSFQSEILDLATGRLGECRHLWNGTGGAHPEGPHVFKKDGWHYLLMAEGGTEFGHMVTIARGKSVWGPFEPCPHNPILSHRSMDIPLQSTGHSDFVEDARGQWWIVFLACRHVGYPKMHHLGRETCLAPVEWKDGWPVVNGGRAVPLEVQTERRIAEQLPPAGFTDGFTSPALGLQWNFRRNPDASAWSLTRSAGHISLRCVGTALSDVASPAFVGCRQKHLACRVSVDIDFAPQTPADEAGFTVMMNEQYRCDIALTSRNGQRVAVLRRCLGSLTAEAAAPIPAGKATLRLMAAPEWYTFSIEPAGGQPVALGKVETRHLSTELAGGFTGVYLGMYASGNGTDSPAWARFTNFIYTPL